MADSRDVQMDGVNPSSKKQSNKSEGWSIDTFFILEVIVMTPIILITIGLFLIPIILFALPPSNSISNNSSEVSYWYILEVLEARFDWSGPKLKCNPPDHTICYIHRTLSKVIDC